MKTFQVMGTKLSGRLKSLLLASAFLMSACSKPNSESTDATVALADQPVPSAAQDQVAPEKQNADSVTVYYFHGDARCKTCLSIQHSIQSTVSTHFEAETASGTLVFREVNTDQPENAHFIKDFELSSSSMIVVARNGDKILKWENCNQVWPLAHQESELAVYTEQQIKSYLNLVRSI